MPTDSYIQKVGTVGAFANWLIPVMTMSTIAFTPVERWDRPLMNGVLFCYSGVFVRWAIAISPANYKLMICHACNMVTQSVYIGKYASQHPDSWFVGGKKDTTTAA